MSTPLCLQIGSLLPMIEDQLSDFFVVRKYTSDQDLPALLSEIGGQVEVIATGGHAKVDETVFSHCQNLRIVANFGVGYDTVDAAKAAEHGIIVTNTPDVLTEEVADTTLALLLIATRELGAAERYIRDGRWPKEGNYPLTPTTLRGRTVGILGLGRIGQAVATRCEAFGLSVEYHTRNEKPGVPYTYHVTLMSLATSVDTLISVLPGGAATAKLINAEVLEALGPNGVLVNIGRGTTVDEAALIEALKSGTIANAGLDVFETEPCYPEELVAIEKVALLPHVGSASVHTRDGMGQLVVDNLKAYLDRKPPLTPVVETPFSSW
ncbi:MAG: 2-hydroxyacid dehydrogenase [Pseudomonadota bacterium]